MPNVPTDEHPLLTIGQAAHRLELSVAWVRHLADAGTLDCTRSPLGRLVTAESVEKYRAEREAAR